MTLLLFNLITFKLDLKCLVVLDSKKKKKKDKCKLLGPQCYRVLFNADNKIQ